MTNLISFDKEFFKRFASGFVDVYEKDGPIAAANYSLTRLPREKYPDAREYITQEFISRGYTFPNREEVA